MTATFYVGDAIETMNRLPEKSVDLVLTSPPFLALRSYLPADHPDKALEGGSQATPGEYVDWLLDVVEACARVLAPHGSLCFELGDTYSGSGGAGGDYAANGLRAGQPAFRQGYYDPNRGRSPRQADDYGETSYVSNSGGRGWPLAKSLSLIPESFRFAMVYGHNPFTGRQTAPWRLRNVIRWVRPNPPVGALGDKFRPATTELMVFCKAKDRYFDLDAVREPLTARALSEVSTGGVKGGESYRSALDGGYDPSRLRLPAAGGGAPPLDWWNIPLTETAKLRGPCVHGRYDAHHSDYWENPYVCPGGEFLVTDSRAPLDWWNIPPGGYPGAHYAVWPPELLIKPIKAMCPEKVCRQCGEPSRRIVGPTEYRSTNGGRVVLNMQEGERLAEGVNQWKGPQGRPGHYVASAPTLGFSDCGCRGRCPTHDFAAGFCVGYCPDRDDSDHWRPGLALDPFAGSGTTLAVATGHGRDAIGIDLDERNYDLALDRVGPFILSKAIL